MRHLKAALALIAAIATLVSLAGSGSADGRKRYGGVAMVVPGMTQTELQSVMGPPDYIQSNGMRQAWQYCPHYFERIWARRVDLWMTVNRVIHFREDLFVTVWFLHGQVHHMRVFPDEVMGSCADFYLAFNWTDPLDGPPLVPLVGLGPVK